MYNNNQLIKNVLDNFRNKNLSYLKDKALFLKTSFLGDDKDRVIIKEDGSYTYFFSDIIYHINKIERSSFLLNV